MDRIADINRKLRGIPDKSKILKSDNQASNIKQDVFEDYIDEVKEMGIYVIGANGAEVKNYMK